MAAGLRRIEDRSSLPRVDDELLDLNEDEFNSLASGLRDQRRQGSCLVCGARSFLSIDIRDGTALNLRHEDCGGQLKHLLKIESFIGRRKVHWYNFAGTLLEIQEDII